MMELEDARRIGQEIDRHEIALLERIRIMTHREYAHASGQLLLDDIERIADPATRARLYRAFAEHAFNLLGLVK